MLYFPDVDNRKFIKFIKIHFKKIQKKKILKYILSSQALSNLDLELFNDTNNEDFSNCLLSS